jgi:multiple sugar transport system substrate-binding protein
MKKTLRALVWIVAFSLCFAVVLTGCAKTGGTDDEQTQTEESTAPEESVPEETPPEEVTLTMWHNFGTDVEAPYFDETIIGMFQQAYPYITVDVVDQGGDQYREMIVTSIATGTTPDVARIDSMDTASFANEGALTALDQFADFNDVAGGLFGGGVDMAVFQGNHYALPLSVDCKAAVCDLDVLGQLGFDAPPATMEEFIDACLTANTGEYMMSVSSPGEWDMMPYFWWFGGDLTDAGFTTADGYANSASSIAAMEKIIELHDEGILTIKDIDGTSDAWEGIQADQYAMFLEGPWFYPIISGYADMNIVPATVPTYDGASASIIGGQSVCMFDTSEHQDAAFTFIKYLVGVDAQLSMADGMGTIPANVQAGNDPSIQADPVKAVYVEQLASAKARIPSPYRSDIEEAIKDAFDQILNEDVTPAEGMNTLAARLDEIIQQ